MRKLDIKIDLCAALKLLYDGEHELIVLWNRGYTQQELADYYAVPRTVIQYHIGRILRKIRKFMSS